MAFKRWLYRGGHPNKLAKIINNVWAIIHSLGISPNLLVTLEVVGRHSGKTISFPLAMTVINGERYLVSMLGEETNWVRNVRAAKGKARLRHGTTEQVLLQEVDAKQRAPILKVFLQHAPGARPHISLSKDAPVSEFEKIASMYPVFRLDTMK
ncbi:MAG TPA: nitroreductase/quinone reductase family protein [Anaerolineales bacterium]|nr:nitroreductase/quinone reductase family protein [Anaerolineales bacterium]